MIWLAWIPLGWLVLWTARIVSWLLLPPRLHERAWNRRCWCYLGVHWRPTSRLDGFCWESECVCCGEVSYQPLYYP